MNTIEDFISRLEDQFDDLPKGELKPASRFRQVFTWNSVNSLILIAMIKTDYNVAIHAEDIRKSETIEDIFKIVESRMAK